MIPTNHRQVLHIVSFRYLINLSFLTFNLIILDESNESNCIKKKKSINMPSTSREIKQEVESDDEIPLRRQSTRICKTTVRFQHNTSENNTDNSESTFKPRKRASQLVLHDFTETDCEYLTPSCTKKLPVCDDRFEVPPITSRKQPSRFHDEEDTEEESQSTKAVATQSRFSNDKEIDQRSTRNLRKKKRWNYAKMLDISGVSSEEGVDDWKPSQKLTKKNSRRKSRDLKSKQKKNGKNTSDQSSNDSSDDDGNDDNDDNDEENNVNMRVSVSSRGRIRKLTAEAKAHLFRR